MFDIIRYDTVPYIMSIINFFIVMYRTEILVNGIPGLFVLPEIIIRILVIVGMIKLQVGSFLGNFVG